MPDAAWWIAESVVLATVGACVVLAALDSRRIGSATPYGRLLWVISTGFWCLFVGTLFYDARIAITGAPARLDVSDIVYKAGWALLILGFLLFAFLFERATPRRLAAWALAVAAALAGGVGAYFSLLDPHGPRDLAAWLAATQIGIDATFVLVLAACTRHLVRLRQTALGKLYLVLSVAVGLNALADVLLYASAARGAPLPYLNALWASAGLTGFVALALHHRLARRLPNGALDNPALLPEQRALRDARAALRGIVGGYADVVVREETAKHAGDARLQRAEEPLAAALSASTWRAVLAGVSARARDEVGERARGTVHDVAQMHGVGLAGAAAP